MAQLSIHASISGLGPIIGQFKGLNRELRLTRDLMRGVSGSGGGGLFGGGAIGRATRETLQWSRAMQQMHKVVRATFLGEGGLHNALARLFAPIATVSRGFGDLQRSVVGLFRAFGTLNPFRALGGILESVGTAGGGISKILSGTIAQIGRLGAAPFRILGALGTGIGGAGGGALSIAGGFFGGLVAHSADIVGEVFGIFGRMFKGLTSLAAAAMQPLAATFDFLISPVTRVFDVISFAWKNSLVIMTGAAALFVKSATQTFLGFERNVSEALSQIPGVAKGAFDEMQTVALGLSRELGKGPTQIVDAIKLATSVGFSSVKEFTEIARAATRTATAGFSDIETTTRTLTNTLNSFGLSADHAGEVADKLFRGFQVGGGSMQFFASGLGTIAATVKAAGGSMDDMIATTALLSRAAAGNSRIFVEVQQAFSRLVSPTTKASEAMRLMGIAVARNEQGGTDFFRTLEGIQTRVKQLSGGDTIKAFRLLKMIFPEERSARAFAKLMSANADSIREVRQAMAGAKGSVADALGQVDQRSFRNIERMAAAWERLKVSAGGLFAPLVAAGAERLGAVFDSIQARIERLSSTGGFDRLSKSFRGLMESLGIKLPTGGIGDFIERLATQKLPEWIDQAAGAVKRLRESLGEFNFPKSVPEALELLKSTADDFITRLTGSNLQSWMDSIADSAKRIADSLQTVLDAFKNLAGIQTPARAITPPFRAGQQQDWLSKLLGIPQVRPEDSVDYMKTWWSMMRRGDFGFKTYSRYSEPGPKMARGGIVPGVGVGDTVPAMLEPGELVVPKRLVQHMQNGGVVTRPQLLAERRTAYRGEMARRREMFAASHWRMGDAREAQRARREKRQAAANFGITFTQPVGVSPLLDPSTGWPSSLSERRGRGRAIDPEGNVHYVVPGGRRPGPIGIFPSTGTAGLTAPQDSTSSVGAAAVQASADLSRSSGGLSSVPQMFATIMQNISAHQKKLSAIDEDLKTLKSGIA